MILPFILGFILTLFHFSVIHIFERGFCIKCSRVNKQVTSFGTGFILAYLLLELMPDIYTQNSILIYTILIGFTFFFFIEKVIYKYIPRYKLKKDLTYVHSSIIFLVNLIGGIAIYSIFTGNVSNAILLFIAFLFLSISDDFALHNIHAKEKPTSYIITSFAFIVGVSLQHLIKFKDILILEGILAGILLFVVSNELIPKEKNKNLIYFILGLVVFIILSLLFQI